MFLSLLAKTFTCIPTVDCLLLFTLFYILRESEALLQKYRDVYEKFNDILKDIKK